MVRSALIIITLTLTTAFFSGCDKAPNGVIKESDMAHVIADFAKAEGIIDNYPDRFADDSSKLALKQSILKKYDADLEMYDSSLVWYAHNLKIYSEVYDKAISILEKEGKFNDKPDNAPGSWTAGAGAPSGESQQMGAIRRIFPSSGDSANVWQEPQQWILTSATHKGYIRYDYKLDKEARNGDLYALNMKMLSTGGGSINILLAIDYYDGTTSYINRTANVYGWSSYSIQTDTARNAKRIYGFIQYDVKPHNVVFLDSIYLLRTHLDATKYNMIGIQRIAGPKSVLEKRNAINETNNRPKLPASLPGFPGKQSPETTQPSTKSIQPKPGLNKSVIPSRDRAINPNGQHLPKPPIK